MLEMTAFVAASLLVIREFLALELGRAPRCLTRFVGLVAIPFVLAFVVLFTLRVMSYLRT